MRIARPLMAAGLFAVSFSALPASSSSAASLPETPVLSWSRLLDSSSLPAQIVRSSPVIAHLTGPSNRPSSSVVVGDDAGNLFALDLATGANVHFTGVGSQTSPVLRKVNQPIDSTPSTARLGGSPFDTVFVGVGSRGSACGPFGGYLALNRDGSTRWRRAVTPPGGLAPCGSPSVTAGITLANLTGTGLDAIAMSLGQDEMAFDAASGSSLLGWSPWFQADSSSSTAAVARFGGPSAPLSVVEGGDSTAGLAWGMQYQNGGHIRIISNLGNGGQHGAGGLICSYDTYANGGQIVESSPAVGNFLANNYVGIASGMGYFNPYPGPPNRIVVINRHCGVVWQRATDFETSSPILADVNGDGRLDVIVGTQAVSQFGGSTSRGSVYAFDGSTGTLLWRVATGSVVGAPVAADLTGKGYADVVVTSADAGPTTGGLQIIDGKTGTKVWSEQGIVGQNSPLVTADPDGTIGITIAGYVGELRGSGACQQSFCLASTVAHYTIPGSSAQWLSRAATSWLQFHHDPQLSGNMAGPNG